jgi:hypothetical protein
MIDLTKTQARARTVTSNREETPSPTFAKASQNVVIVVALIDTLPAPSTDMADEAYGQLKDILSVATTQQAENSL